MWRVRYDKYSAGDGVFSLFGPSTGDTYDVSPPPSDTAPLGWPVQETVPWVTSGVYEPGWADPDSENISVQEKYMDIGPEYSFDAAYYADAVQNYGDSTRMEKSDEEKQTVLPKAILNGDVFNASSSKASDKKAILPAHDVIQSTKDHHDPDSEDDDVGQKAPTDLNVLLYGNHYPIFWAVFVRVFLIGHNVLTVWRVTEAYESPIFWLLAAGNLFLLLELHVVIVKRAGIEYSW